MQHVSFEQRVHKTSNHSPTTMNYQNQSIAHHPSHITKQHHKKQKQKEG